MLHQAAGDQPNFHEITFRLTVEGTARALRPRVFDDVARIAREAVANAYKHSSAGLIEVELVYSPALFTCIVRDNGKGIHQPIIERGRQGHWVCQECASVPNAPVANCTCSGGIAGTEVVLSLEVRVAYSDADTRRDSRRWFGP